MTPANLTECLQWLDEANSPDEGPAYKEWLKQPEGQDFPEFVASRVAECLRGHLAQGEAKKAPAPDWTDPGHRLTQIELDIAARAYNDAKRGPNGPIVNQPGWIEAAIRAFLAHNRAQPTPQASPGTAPAQAKVEPLTVPGPVDPSAKSGTRVPWNWVETYAANDSWGPVIQALARDLMDMTASYGRAMEKLNRPAPVPEVSPAPTTPKICNWERSDANDPDDDCWDTDCGKAFVMNDGTPQENDLKFCCFCGGSIPTPTDPADGGKEAQP